MKIAVFAMPILVMCAGCHDNQKPVYDIPWSEFEKKLSPETTDFIIQARMNDVVILDPAQRGNWCMYIPAQNPRDKLYIEQEKKFRDFLISDASTMAGDEVKVNQVITRHRERNIQANKAMDECLQVFGEFGVTAADPRTPITSNSSVTQPSRP